MASKIIEKDTVFLIDGSGYIFRAYYAVRPLTSSNGVPTNAVYGFTIMLLKLLKEHNPQHLAIAFDTKAPNFRKKIYEGYKANRPPPPEDLIPQFELIHKVVEALNIKLLMKDGYEADDLIGTAAKMAKSAGKKVMIVTADKDFMQLVDDDVFLLDEMRAAKTGSAVIVDAKGVVDKFGVEPKHVIDILALAGDASDNVAGVRGIGGKTAALLVNEYGPLESILNAAPLIKQKSRREKLIRNSDMARLSKKLVIIDCDADYPMAMSEFEKQTPNKQKLFELFEELNFKRLLQDRYFNNNSENKEVEHKKANTSQYLCVTTEKQLANVVDELQKVERFAIDTETDGLDSMQCSLVGLSLSWADNKAAYIPLAHTSVLQNNQLAVGMVQNALNPLLVSKKVVAQNAKFDQKVLMRAGFKPFVFAGDPMLASYLLEADTAKHNLDDLSKSHLHHQPITFKEVCGSGRNKITFNQVDLAQAIPYAAEDADLALRLANVLGAKIKEEGFEKLYYELELPTEQVLCYMEAAGVKIDASILAQMSVEFGDKLASLEKQAYNLAGQEFNLASPKQVSEILFGKLGLEVVKKTKTGFSTDSSVLEKFANAHELPKVMLEHRAIAKLKSTYVDALPKLVNQTTGRIHTSFNQAVAATGRLSSSAPNLQNIPARTKEGRRIRGSFVAEKDYVLISLDYSQVELRLLAHMSDDKVMLDAFNNTEDVHQRTASEIFDVSLNEVNKTQRNYAKTINFGLLYGMGTHRLSQALVISRKEASSYINKYYERYAGVFAWQEELLQKAREQGEVCTMFGRRRKLPELLSKNHMLVQRAERMAINTPIQGTAADMIKIAMIKVNKLLQAKHPKAKMVLQVHDELVIECPKNEADKVVQKVKEIMENSIKLKVPMVVDSGIAANWADAH